MKRFSVAVLLCVALALPMHSVSAMSGRELLSLCKSTNAFKRGFCSGAIQGFFEGHFRGRIVGAVNGAMWYANRFKADKNTIMILSPSQTDELVEEEIPYCPPKHTTASQVVTVGVEYLANHPNSRYKKVDELLPAAFEQAWPCKE